MPNQESPRLYGWIILGAGLIAYVFRGILEFARAIPGGAYPYWLLGAPWASFWVGHVVFAVAFILLALADWRRPAPSRSNNIWISIAFQIACGVGLIGLAMHLYQSEPQSHLNTTGGVVAALFFLLPVHGIGVLFLHAGVRNIFRAMHNRTASR